MVPVLRTWRSTFSPSKTLLSCHFTLSGPYWYRDRGWVSTQDEVGWALRIAPPFLGCASVAQPEAGEPPQWHPLSAVLAAGGEEAEGGEAAAAAET